MNKKINDLINKRGSAMVITMLIIMALVAVLMSVIPFTIKQSRNVVAKHYKLKAFYTAESAVRKLLYEYTLSQHLVLIDTITASNLFRDSINGTDSNGLLSGQKYDLVSGYEEAISPFSNSPLQARVFMMIKGSYLNVIAECSYRKEGVKLEYVYGTRLPEELDAALVLYGTYPLEEVSEISGRIKTAVPPEAAVEAEPLDSSFKISNF
ncbi:MAG: hypothetical protein ABIA63_14000, partial [bacterium]